MDKTEFLNFLKSQKETNQLSGFYIRTAEIVSQFIPDLKTAKLLLENNKNIISSITDVPGLANFVHKFIEKVITDRKIESVLDPWANFGEMLYLTSNVFPKANKKGYVLNNEIFDFNNIVKVGFDQKLGNAIDLLQEEKIRYDLIISNLPVGLSSKSSIHGLARIDVGLQIMIESLSVLSDDGLLLSTVNASIFESSNAEKFKSVLIERGYCIKAILGTPVKSINQNAMIPFYLILIEKGIQEKVFLADITDDGEEQGRIIENYKRQRNAKQINEGVLLPVAEIKPISNIIVQRESDFLVKRTGLPLVQLGELGKFVKLKDVESDYLVIQKYPNKRVELNPTKGVLDERFSYFFQINTEVVEPKYLLELLNSPLGNKILNSIASGTILPVLRIKDLVDVCLPVNTLQSQKEIIELDRNIQNIEDQFRNLRQELWKNPKQSGGIEKKFKSLVKDPNSVEWMEMLPFPLASILWGYHSESKTHKKVEYLFLFFEGLCEFVDILLLSALNSNIAFFETTVGPWIKNDRMQNWYVKASFGGWQKLHEKLAKNIRTFYNSDNEGEKEIILSLFCGANEEYINMLTSKQLVILFSEVNKFRNDHKGHSGLISEGQLKENLSWLESKFFSLKGKLCDGFSNVKLISPNPNSATWDDEFKMFTTNCRLLTGVRTKFRQLDIQTNKPLSPKKLYLIHEEQFSPIEVLPLVQMRETPKTEHDACFFYNRIDGEKVRLVSYHFDKEAEIIEPLSDISNVIKLLNPK